MTDKESLAEIDVLLVYIEGYLDSVARNTDNAAMLKICDDLRPKIERAKGIVCTALDGASVDVRYECEIIGSCPWSNFGGKACLSKDDCPKPIVAIYPK